MKKESKNSLIAIGILIILPFTYFLAKIIMDLSTDQLIANSLSQNTLIGCSYFSVIFFLTFIWQWGLYLINKQSIVTQMEKEGKKFNKKSKEKWREIIKDLSIGVTASWITIFFLSSNYLTIVFLTSVELNFLMLFYAFYLKRK